MRRSLHTTTLSLLTLTGCGGGPIRDETVLQPDGGRVHDSDASTEPGDEPDDDAHDADAVPSDWPRVQGSCGISLQGPTLVASFARGIDSCVAKFVAPGCTYFADVGGFSDPLNAPRDQVENVRINGRVARMVTSGRDPGPNLYFVGVHFPAPLWSDVGTVSATISASCNTPEALDTARLVLQSVELPTNSSATTAPPADTLRCSGEDIRPVTGDRLGRSCTEGKVEVPGTCALGARTNGATGNGQMVCFVSKAGDYYWAHVAYGETVGGTGSRHAGAEAIQGSELTEAEEQKCQQLVEMLGTGEKLTLGGELSYQACP